MDNVILELFESCNYFASQTNKKQLYLIVTYQVIYIHAASIDYKKQDSAVLITIRCEKKKLIEYCLFVPKVKLVFLASLGNQF